MASQKFISGKIHSFFLLSGLAIFSSLGNASVIPSDHYDVVSSTQLMAKKKSSSSNFLSDMPIVNKQKLHNIFISQLNESIKVESEKKFTTEFGFVTNYIFRGISQTNNKPALQGFLSYSFSPTGLYVAIFGSHDDFKDGNNKTVSYELDPAIGISNEIGEHFNYDISLSRYNYPQSQMSSYDELITFIKYYFIKAEFDYSSDDFATGKSGTYYNLGFNYDIPPRFIFCINNLNISGGIGYSSLPNVGLHNYYDYNLTLSKSIKQFTFSLQWTDTNHRAIDAASLTDSKIIGKISVSI